MKNQGFMTTVVLLVAYVLSACGSALPTTELPPSDQAAVKVQAVQVAFTGVVEVMNGSDWTVNGHVLTVDPAVVRDGPFQVGDTIKVEGTVNADGSLSISRVEAPSAAELAELPQLGNDNGNTNFNGNDNISIDPNGNANTNTNTNMNTNANNNGNVNANNNSNENNTNGGNINDNDNDDDSNANLNSNDDRGNSNSNSNDDDSGGGNDNNSGGNDNGEDDRGNSNDD
jgi:hypothetical protein